MMTQTDIVAPTLTLSFRLVDFLPTLTSHDCVRTQRTRNLYTDLHNKSTTSTLTYLITPVQKYLCMYL